MKIIVVAATKRSGDQYVIELIKKHKIENALSSDFNVCFLREMCIDTPSEIPFIVIPFNYNESAEQLDTIGHFSDELWVRNHEEITENNINEYLT